MTDRRASARQLTASLLAGPWTRDALLQRATRALPDGLPDPAGLVNGLLGQYPAGHAPPPRPLEQAILADPGFQLAWGRPGLQPPRIRLLLSSPVMEAAIAGIDAESLPPLPTLMDTARWLGVSAGQLDWLADCEERNTRLPDGPLTHYRYHWKPRRDGSARLIEVPKPRLKRIQRRIVAQILDAVPPHSAAHGFRAGHSTLSYAAPHTNRAVVARFDLEDFFPSIDRKQVIALFRSLGYPYRVARTLAGLCSNSVPSPVLLGQHKPAWQRRKRLMTAHLPQGAPTSPAIANLCAYRLDCRLSGLVRSIGLSYTRYADDLAFSGPERLARDFGRFHLLVARIMRKEGFALNTLQETPRLPCPGVPRKMASRRSGYLGDRNQREPTRLNRQPSPRSGLGRVVLDTSVRLLVRFFQWYRCRHTRCGAVESPILFHVRSTFISEAH